MAISIKAVTVTPSVLNIGETFTIIIRVEDVSWNTIKNDFQNWNEIKTTLTNWNKVKNHT